MLATLLGSEKRATIQQLGHPAAGVIGWMTGRNNPSGVHVDEYSALNYSAVWAAHRIISETVAGLPLFPYLPRDDGGKDRAREHRLYRLLHDEPNPEMTKYTYFETQTSHLVGWGNCYSEIEHRGANVEWLWPITPDRPRIMRTRGTKQLWYSVKNNDAADTELMAEDMLHVPGLGFDGIKGYSVIAMAAASLGVSIAAEHYGGRFFDGDAMPQGVLSHQRILSDQARTNLRNEWRSLHGGVEKSHNVAILQEGMTYQAIGIKPEEAQFLGTRLFGITEVARWFRLPPTMLADLTHGTHSNVEQESLNFVLFSITSWLRRWEQAMNRRLFTEAEKRAGMFVEFLVDGLLRGDTQTRFASYATARQWGWLSINDIRRLENMNPIEGGDVYLQPLNMVDASQPPDSEQQPPEEDEEIDTEEDDEDERQERVRRDLAPIMAESEKRAAMAMGSLFAGRLKEELRDNMEATVLAVRQNNESAIQSLRSDREEITRELKDFEGRISVQFSATLATLKEEYEERAKREREEVKRAARIALQDVIGLMLAKEIEAAQRHAKNPARFVEQTDRFYETHRSRFQKAIAAPLRVYLVASGDTRDVDECAKTLAGDFAEQSKESLLACAECQASELPQRVESETASWPETRVTFNLTGAA